MALLDPAGQYINRKNTKENPCRDLMNLFCTNNENYDRIIDPSKTCNLARYLNHSMQLHFVHHLHPGIGHYDEPKAIEALKPFLIARKVPGADQIPDRVSLNPLIKI